MAMHKMSDGPSKRNMMEWPKMIQIIKSAHPHLTMNRGEYCVEYWGSRWVVQIGWWICLIGMAQ